MTLKLRVAVFAAALYLRSAISTNKEIPVLVEDKNNTVLHCSELDNFTDEAMNKLWPIVFGSELFTAPVDYISFDRLKVEYFNQLEHRLVNEHGLNKKQAQGVIIFADRLRTNWRKGLYLGGRHEYFGSILAEMRRWSEYNSMTSLKERAWIVRQDLLDAKLGDKEGTMFEALGKIEQADGLADIDVPLPLLDLLAFAGLPTVYHTRKRVVESKTPIRFNRKQTLLV